jgi:hypothetical protein
MVYIRKRETELDSFDQCLGLWSNLGSSEEIEVSVAVLG